MKTPKSFEEGMERLNGVLAQMQSEETTLADSVKLYAEAAALMEYCRAALEKTSLHQRHWMQPVDSSCRRRPRSAVRHATACWAAASASALCWC
mgnify:CR=1 FL=1